MSWAELKNEIRTHEKVIFALFLVFVIVFVFGGFKMLSEKGDYKILVEAVAKRNPSLCQNAEKGSDEVCFRMAQEYTFVDFLLESENIDILMCDYIVYNDDLKSYCQKNIGERALANQAIEGFDMDKCEDIQEVSLREYCQVVVSERTYAKEAIEEGNINKCEKITVDDNLKTFCIENSTR